MDRPNKGEFKIFLESIGLAVDEDGTLYKTRNCKENLGVTPELALMLALVKKFGKHVISKYFGSDKESSN